MCVCVVTLYYMYWWKFGLMLCNAFSVHDLESLEDWDSIRGENFSLEQEDFGSLDERLTSAFQHLILPSDWNLLGDPTTGVKVALSGSLCS